MVDTSVSLILMNITLKKKCILYVLNKDPNIRIALKQFGSLFLPVYDVSTPPAIITKGKCPSSIQSLFIIYLSTTTCLKARFSFRQMCWFSCSLAFIFVSFIIISIYHYVYYRQSIILVSFLEYKNLGGFCKYQ